MSDNRPEAPESPEPAPAHEQARYDPQGGQRPQRVTRELGDAGPRESLPGEFPRAARLWVWLARDAVTGFFDLVTAPLSELSDGETIVIPLITISPERAAKMAPRARQVARARGESVYLFAFDSAPAPEMIIKP